jgi:hypothetical protein
MGNGREKLGRERICLCRWRQARTLNSAISTYLVFRSKIIYDTNAYIELRNLDIPCFSESMIIEDTIAFLTTTKLRIYARLARTQTQH